jgi:hypothetical protein
MMDDKYHPRSFEEMVEDPIPTTIINEPICEVIELRPGQKAHSLHAVLCDALTSSRGLLQRLESGVRVGREGEARAAVRALLCADAYVQMRRTVAVLERCLELPDLE